MDDPVQRIHEVIDRELPRRHSNRVMHAHPSPTLWLERDVPLADIVGGRARSETGGRRKLSVYVGTPYCLPTTPDRCGFCLFPSEVYRSPDQLVTYLRYLAMEGDPYRPWLEDVEAARLVPRWTMSAGRRLGGAGYQELPSSEEVVPFQVLEKAVSLMMAPLLPDALEAKPRAEGIARRCCRRR